jgi:hypothetical protein
VGDSCKSAPFSSGKGGESTASQNLACSSMYERQHTTKLKIRIKHCLQNTHYRLRMAETFKIKRNNGMSGSSGLAGCCDEQLCHKLQDMVRSPMQSIASSISPRQPTRRLARPGDRQEATGGTHFLLAVGTGNSLTANNVLWTFHLSSQANPWGHHRPAGELDTME